MLTFELATHREICGELCERLRQQRLIQNLSQDEVAARAGLSRGTVKNLESKQQVSLESMVRVVMVLGLADSLAELFVPRAPKSIREMEAMSVTRKRASKSAR